MISFIKAIIFSMFFMISFSAFSYDVKKIETTEGNVYRISMRPGEIAIVNEENFYIVINEVADYRCPQGMLCYWNGPFVLKGVFVYEEIKSFELTYDKEPLNIFNEFGYTASIVDASTKDGIFWIYLKVN